MTLLSNRYALGLTAVLALASIPVVLHSYVGFRRDDCAHPMALVPNAEDGELGERSVFLRSTFAASQIRQGVHRPVGARIALHHATVRSYDPKRLYYRPDHYLAENRKPEGRDLEILEVEGARLSVFRPRFPRPTPISPVTLAAYLLVYRGEPVARPIHAQLRSAIQQAITGASPMTLFFAWTEVSPADTEEAEARLREWISRQWVRYHEICTP